MDVSKTFCVRYEFHKDVLCTFSGMKDVFCTLWMSQRRFVYVTDVSKRLVFLTDFPKTSCVRYGCLKDVLCTFSGVKDVYVHYGCLKDFMDVSKTLWMSKKRLVYVRLEV